MTEYELALIIKTSTDESDIKKCITSIEKEIEKANGKIQSKDDWGKRKLSYKISKEDTGYYYFLVFSLDPQLVSKIEKFLGLETRVLRYLLGKIDN